MASDVLTRNEYDRKHRYLVWVIIVQFVLIVMASGLLYTIAQASEHERCTDNLKRTQVAATLLPKIVAAAEADGDAKMAAFWRDYLVQLRSAPPVQC